MKRRFTDEQIIGVLKEHEAGVRAKELCRKHGMSDATFYKWKAKFSGMEVNEARRLRDLEDENRYRVHLSGDVRLGTTERRWFAVHPTRQALTKRLL